MAEGTSFWKVFFGVLAAIVVASGCVVGACVVLVGGMVGSTAKTMAEQEKARREYMKHVDVTITEFSQSDSGNYGKVKGSVTNKGNRVVTYWKVRLNFVDKAGAIVDSSFENDADRLPPGSSKSFDTMQAWNPRMKKVQYEIEEIRLE